MWTFGIVLCASSTEAMKFFENCVMVSSSERLVVWDITGECVGSVA